ncbi:MAG: M20/M25/M40 family metallo-hydrolase [Candidatus Thalassarchaeaceae archaeon]|nr:M20/M25/M40 family metallo-hydrolase [Candidatus Thalassarchaeaceae archaeon]
MASINFAQIHEWVDEQWEGHALESLERFIEIPALSPAFDEEWAANGYLDATIDHFVGWLGTLPMEGITCSVHRIQGRTPVLIVQVEGTGEGEVLFYSHLDKQPPFTGWSEGKGPWIPVREDPWLFGRGSVDDGYGGYLSILSILALQQHGIPHPKSTFLIETCEESGSFDLPAYLDELSDLLGTPDLVVVMDSGAGDYERLWVTTSLRGLVGGTLRVGVSKEGVHSGMAGGIIPSSFRIARSLISRIEDEGTGNVLLPELTVNISDELRGEAQGIADVLGDNVWTDLPALEGLQPQTPGITEVILSGNWRPSLSVTGADGIPSIANAGNVLRTHTSLKLSMRIPPGVDADHAESIMKAALEADSPHGAHVSFEADAAANGFSAPSMDPSFRNALNEASLATFGNPMQVFFEGGTIPFLAMMQEKYPNADFLVTGSLGPGGNAHGPDEKLHIPATKAVTTCVAAAIASLNP